jgi:hypothetical protein
MLRSVFALPFLLVASISMARSPKPEELPVSSGSSIQRVAAARARAGSCRTFLPHGRSGGRTMPGDALCSCYC